VEVSGLADCLAEAAAALADARAAAFAACLAAAPPRGAKDADGNPEFWAEPAHVATRPSKATADIFILPRVLVKWRMLVARQATLFYYRRFDPGNENERTTAQLIGILLEPRFSERCGS